MIQRLLGQGLFGSGYQVEQDRCIANLIDCGLQAWPKYGRRQLHCIVAFATERYHLAAQIAGVTIGRHQFQLDQPGQYSGHRRLTDSQCLGGIAHRHRASTVQRSEKWHLAGLGWQPAIGCNPFRSGLKPLGQSLESAPKHHRAFERQHITHNSSHNLITRYITRYAYMLEGVLFDFLPKARPPERHDLIISGAAAIDRFQKEPQKSPSPSSLSAGLRS